MPVSRGRDARGGRAAHPRSRPPRRRPQALRRLDARRSPDEPDAIRTRPIEELLAELDGLVGLEPVKAEVKLLTNLLQVQSFVRNANSR